VDEDEPGEAAQDMVEICHKPGTPAQKTLTVPASAVPGHVGHGDSEGACTGSVDPPVDEPEVDATGKVVICHKPGTPAEQTLEIAASALDAHLGHGDTVDACAVEEVTEPGDESEEEPQGRAVICHKPGTPDEQTMTVPRSALDAHLAHGDTDGECSTATSRVLICHQPYTPAQKTLAVPESDVEDHLAHGDLLGSCDDLPTEPVVAPGTEPGEDATAKVEICHQPGTPAQQTLAVSESDVADHLAHGDSLGACEETLEVTADAPWVARLMATALSIVLKLQELATSLTL
jgi:hypothetical protein